MSQVDTAHKEVVTKHWGQHVVLITSTDTGEETAESIKKGGHLSHNI